jgi:glycosyltransferase involved in cell wall biosynthesis
VSLCRPLTIFIPHSSGLLTDHRPHGDGLVCHALISRLAERGHQLYVAASRTDLQKELPRGAHLYDLKARPGDGVASRLHYMWRVRKLFQSLQVRTEFDLVHQLNPVFTGVSIALAGCGLPILLGPLYSRWPGDPTALSSSRHGWQSSLLEKGRTLTASLQQNLADCLLLATTGALQQIVRGPRCPSSVEIFPPGVDSTIFCPSPPRNAYPANDGVSGPVTILFLANVVRRKGIFDLLQAFDRVVQRYPRSQLTVSGTGPQLAEAQSIASSMRAHDQVRFVGHQSRAGTIELYQSADIYCLPSHGEPYGVTATEAMSCGKPLVVTDAGGLGGLIDDQGGLRVPVADPDRLADALCTLIADPARRQAMGEHNRRRVLETMTWDRVVDRLEEIYIATIDRKRRKRDGREAPATMRAPTGTGLRLGARRNDVSAD